MYDPIDPKIRHETYRGTLQGETPDGDRSTIIVTRQGSRVWLTMHGSWQGTVTFDVDQVERLVALLDEASQP